MKARTCVAVAAAIAIGTIAPGALAAGGHDHGGSGGGTAEPGQGPVGVLIVDHGEPPVYNADTYESFRAFIGHLIAMGVIPGFLTAIDTGTIMQDPDCYGCPADPAHGTLIDAWLGTHDEPGSWTPSMTDDIDAHYVLPGSGPGAGEPDVFEHGGLATWHEWELMGGRSPNYDQKLAKKRRAISALRHRFGDEIEIAVGYGIDPRINGRVMDIESAIAKLAAAGVSRIVVVYHGVGFSDMMQTHMIRHGIEDAVAEHSPGLALSYAQPLGASRAYRRAVIAETLRELERVPRDAPVAVHLSGHGLPTDMCGAYDCGADAYHAQSAALFERTSRELRKAISRPGRTEIFSLYGDGATDADDPGEEVQSPIEALDARVADGFEHVIDVPYEFDSDSRDTLIVLREGYERPIPDWNRRYESRFEYGGMEVKLGNASFGTRLKALALERVAAAAIERAMD